MLLNYYALLKMEEDLVSSSHCQEGAEIFGLKGMRPMFEMGVSPNLGVAESTLKKKRLGGGDIMRVKLGKRRLGEKGVGEGRGKRNNGKRVCEKKKIRLRY